MRLPLFRIWYSTTYTTLLIILFLLLAITPAETIYQSIKAAEIQKLFVIGGVYLLTFLIVLLIYSTRIYTNRTVLQAIPKGYVPVEKGEVGKGIRRMVVKHLRRSAIIAWDSRPRDVRGEVDDAEDEEGHGNGEGRPNTAGGKKEKDKDKEKAQKKKGHHHAPDATIIPVSAKSPPWGHVSHPGWASPSSPDLPNLQYWSVICELPNLIEAKAVSLAPPDPAIEEGALQYPDNAPPLPDAQIVTLLQRPRAMGLREYLARLGEFGLVQPPSLGPKFLARYEYARFSTDSLTEAEFRSIMSVFAAILSGMAELHPAVIEEARAQSILSDTRSLAPTDSSVSDSSSSHSHLPYRTPQLGRQRSVSSYGEAESLASSDEGTHSPQTLHSAPSRQRQRSSVFATPRTPSKRSLRSESETGSVLVHEVPRRSPSTILPNSSTSSLRSAQSVIRLHPNPSEGELPYEYHIDGG
ncbi:sucrase/ferredoxin domain-containing protein [Cucurbitaria berberidis CBS 394.84]|uniref:Defect at low temperature protein 1 n=1 Tax=Cucurbitaria berberidis CBS 394.84 TaxID=1168544 RepID=A0A9P4L7Y6_9PLEO|nr:sucrase/ferredoxin domain-containing protein [Cucurbitaria berberidis CBS 394.84]KAF1845466.1 sucrase/ferredoxin domain-containing protein [Cucurbitaria berberidis CBS 394.84]